MKGWGKKKEKKKQRKIILESWAAFPNHMTKFSLQDMLFVQINNKTEIHPHNNNILGSNSI